jgi:chemotaxis protein histidine kinase CheA/CheY-like chemotaxis protein
VSLGDEAMPVRTTPDFSAIALAALLDQSSRLEQLIRDVVCQEKEIAFEQLQTSAAQMHATLVLLSRPGAALIAEELSAAVAFVNLRNDEITEAEAHTLLKTTETFSDYIGYLQWPGAIDSAIAALPILNECRALRDADLLSESLLLAAGIQLPDAAHLPKPDKAELERFTQQLKASRQPLMQAMLSWYKGEDLSPVMRDLAAVLDDMATACHAPSQIQTLVALFESAAVVADALGTTELASDSVLKHQFAQLERLLQRWVSLTPDDFPLHNAHSPDSVFRNFLYTIATENISSNKAVALRKQFDLELFKFKNELRSKQRFVPSKVSTALARSVRESVLLEIEALQRWLSQAAVDPSHNDAINLRERLAQLEPALAMLDEQRALTHLVSINSGLASLARKPQDNTRESRLEIAQATIQFRRSLERQHQLPQTGVNPFTDLAQSSDNPDESPRTLEDHPQHKLLQQAQHQLQRIEHSLEPLFETPEREPDKRDQLVMHQARQGLEEIDQVLQILPLPEVSPLIGGMQSFLNYCAVQRPGLRSRNQFAELLVSTDYYLASVLSPHDSASQLLMNAEVIMQHMEHSISAEVESDDDELDETQIITISGDALSSLIETTLGQMTVVGNQLHVLKEEGSLDKHDEAWEKLSGAWQQLYDVAKQQSAFDLKRLAQGNIDAIARVESQTLLAKQAMPLLDESHAVLPQLIDQHQGHSDRIAGFDDLVEALAFLDKVELANDDASTNVESPHEHATHASTGSTDVPTDHVHDSTLQQVFYQECEGHIHVLQDALSLSEKHPNEVIFALPTAAVLRALHTLTGTAQTVGESSIITLVQPLQKVALLRQRANKHFDAEEVGLYAQVVKALRARVDALHSGNDASRVSLDVEHAISEFAAAAAEQPPELVPSDQALEQKVVASLQGVFVEEATELLAQMRGAVDQHKAGTIDTQGLLDELKSPVHTLKGSARMAGFADFASRAHDIETLLSVGLEVDVNELEHELATMQPMLLPEQNITIPDKAPAPQVLADDHVTVSETGFAKMMTLATQASVSQARLGEQLLRLNEIYRDLDSSTSRLRQQMHKSLEKPTVAQQEMLADLDAARNALASTLQVAESEHLQGSRADAELQQSLIRAQLVQFGACEARLDRAIQDTAQYMDVEVSMQFSGTSINLDRALYRQLLGPLEHLVRNAVAHGIESKEQRLANDKPVIGKVVVQADLDGNDLVISIKDDGGGIDVERINNARVASGKSQLETGQALRDALCESGFSTRDQVDEIAGRGMGLAVADQLAIALGGSLQIASVPGAGTTVSLRLPQKVVVNQVVLVRCGKAHYAIPVKFVHTVLAELENVTDTHEFNGRQYTSHSLAQMLGLQDDAQSISTSLYIRQKGKTKACVLTKASDKHIALHVDAVVGYREIVAQSIGTQLVSLGRFRGGSVLANGTAVLILDMPRILNGLPDIQEPVLPALQAQSRVALVVDDSITMRVAAEHFLEEQGIQSRMARDGIEALSMIQQQLPDIMLLDIDMPRLNGFELLQHLRQLYPNHTLPIIMISTRSGKAEQDKAKALGAGHFIGKPYHAAELHAALCELGIIDKQIS